MGVFYMLAFPQTLQSDSPLTLTHYVTKITAHCLERYSELNHVLRIQEFLQFTLNLSCPALGMSKDRFGSAMITNVGALGIENAFIPLSPYSRCPLLIGIGKPRKAAVVEGDAVVAADVVTLTLTFDHRHADGAHGSHLIRRFKKIFLNPEAHRHVFEEDTRPDRG